MKISYAQKVLSQVNGSTANDFQADENPPQPKIVALEFPENLFDSLPKILKTGAATLVDKTDKDVFLMGALGVISGVLPNYFGIYDGKRIAPNLYVYVLGQAGEGKSGLSYAKNLGKFIQADFLDGRLKNPATEPDQPATERGRQMLFVPANNSKSGFIEIFENNGGRGILFETEGDTLAAALKSEHGNYSDLLRNAFGHEAINFYRRGNKEYRNVELPRLSAVLSSTFGQLLNLIPNPENGLFSRFLFFNIRQTSIFRDVFDARKNDYSKTFDALAFELHLLFRTLEVLDETISFEIQAHQKEQFTALFQQWKLELFELTNGELNGTVNRLGLICFRLAMIFTMLRTNDRHELSERLICDDLDFQNALQIVEVCKSQAIAVFNQLPRHSFQTAKPSRYLTDDQKKQMQKLKLDGFSESQIAHAVLGKPELKGTVNKVLAKLGNG